MTAIANPSRRRCGRAGKLESVRWKDVDSHTLRHTFISRLVMAGVDLRTVQELAGHREIKMTMRYAHLAPEQKRRAIGLLEKQVSTKVPTLPNLANASA